MLVEEKTKLHNSKKEFVHLTNHHDATVPTRMYDNSTSVSLYAYMYIYTVCVLVWIILF